MSEEIKRKINLSGLNIQSPESKNSQEDKELEILNVPEEDSDTLKEEINQDSVEDNEESTAKSGKISLAGMRAKRGEKINPAKKTELKESEEKLETEEKSDGPSESISKKEEIKELNKESSDSVKKLDLIKNTGDKKHESEKTNSGEDEKITSLDDKKVQIVLDISDKKKNNDDNAKSTKKDLTTKDTSSDSNKKNVKSDNKKGEKESLFSNYTSDFEKDEGSVIEKIKELSQKPQTRIVLVAFLIISTLVGIAGLFLLYPEKHSISNYKSVLVGVYDKYTGNGAASEETKESSQNIQQENGAIWEEDSVIRTGYRIGIQTQTTDTGEKRYKFNNQEFDTLDTLNTEIDIEIKKLQTTKVKDFLLNSGIKKTNDETLEQDENETSQNNNSGDSGLDLLKNRK